MSLFWAILLLAGLALFVGGIGWLRLGALQTQRRLEAAVIAPLPRPVRHLPEALTALATVTAEALPKGTVALRLEQRGELRLTEDGAWLPFRARQTVSLTKPAFIWVARARLLPRLPGLFAEVIDAHDGRHALLEARLLGLARLARAEGPELAVAEAQRYLAELAWAPGALAFNGHLDFRSTGPHIEVATSTGRHIARADLLLDANGLISAAGAAERARGGAGAVERLPWGGAFDDWSDRFGPPLPLSAEVWWDLPQGRFTYFRAEITGMAPLDAEGRVLSR